jgi:hypothetical protein
MFLLAMSDDMSVWNLVADGSWIRSKVDESGAPLRDFQDAVMQTITERQGK